jgi:beta-xylosidase
MICHAFWILHTALQNGTKLNLKLFLCVVLHKQIYTEEKTVFNHLKPTGHVMHQQFNIQQLYALPTLYFCVLYLSENKQRLVPLTA